jgi:D-alanine-D-alanine ligase
MASINVPKKVLLLHNHDNTWTNADLIEVAEENRRLMTGLRAHGYHVEDVKVYDSVARSIRAGGYLPEDWLIFNWCEGYADRPWDYDGVAEELEQLRFVYTGAGPWALRISRDKWLVRRLLAEAGVTLPIGTVAHTPRDLSWNLFPAIVKPLNQHGSYGISRDSIVEDEEQLRQQIESVCDTFHAPALIEEYIAGPEFHVTVWGNTLPEVLPAVQLEYSHVTDRRDQIYTYDAKFDEHSAAMKQLWFLCPAMMENNTRAAIRSNSLRSYQVLKCRDYARIDVRVRDGQAYVIDVNANADINSESIVLMAAEAAGMNYNGMVSQIVRFAAERWVAVPRSVLAAQPQVFALRS